MQHSLKRFHLLAPYCAVLILLSARSVACQAPPEATQAFARYAEALESRLEQQHRSPASFLAPASQTGPAETQLRSGEVVLQKIDSPALATPGALLHHWRGTVFVPGATAAQCAALLRDYKAYTQHFAPEVLRADALPSNPGLTRLQMRVRQHHVITVVLDGTYDVSSGELDPRHQYSNSRSVHIEEIADAGRPTEHALTPRAEHGFLWNQNTYWSLAERDGGVYLQIESISLSRDIPHGLGWAVRPYVESIPRQSLEFTLRSARNALHR